MTEEAGMNANQLTQQLLHRVNASWIAQAVYAAVELGLPERLAHGPRAVADLAGECHVPVYTLERLLRALITVDVFVQNPDGTFALTETGRRLCADHPESIRSWVIWWTSTLPMPGRNYSIAYVPAKARVRWCTVSKALSISIKIPNRRRFSIRRCWS